MSKNSDILSGLLAIANAIENSLKVDGETALHCESNLPTAISSVAKAIYRLGNADASTPMGALEAIGKAILDSAERHSPVHRRLGRDYRGTGGPQKK